MQDVLIGGHIVDDETYGDRSDSLALVLLFFAVCGQSEGFVYYLLDSLCIPMIKEQMFLLLSSLSSIFG